MKLKHLTLIITTLLLLETTSPIYLAVELNEHPSMAFSDELINKEIEEEITLDTDESEGIEDNETTEEEFTEEETNNSTEELELEVTGEPTIESEEEVNETSERKTIEDNQGIIETNNSYLPWHLEDDGTLYFSSGQLNGSNSTSIFKLSTEFNKSIVESTKVITFEGEVILNYGMDDLFSDFINLSQINNIENMNGSNMTSSRYMFRNTPNLTYIDWSHKTLSFYKMEGMFQSSSVETVDFTNTSFPITVSMAYLFQSCLNLNDLKIDGLSAPRLTNIDSFINNTPQIINLDLDGQTLYLPTMNNMFAYSNIQSANLNNLEIPITTTMENLFNNAIFLHTFTMDGISGPNVTNTSSMFLGQTNLRHIDWSNHTIGLKSLASMFSSSKIETVNFDGLSLPITTDISKLFAYSSLSAVTMDNFNGPNITNAAEIFASTKNLTSLDWTNHTINIKNANHFFASSYLKSINLLNVKMPITTATKYFFSYNSQLTDLEINGFTAPLSTSNHNWFTNTKITELDWSHKTLNIPSARYLFYSSKLESVNLDYIQLPLTTEMDLLFSKVSTLQTVSMINIYAPKLKTTGSMFRDTTNLSQLTLSFEPEVELTNTGSMFNGASQLEVLDLSTINIEKTLNVIDMFANTSSLRSLTLGDKTVLERSVSLPEAARDSSGKTIDGFTGLWQTIGTGSVEEPNGNWSGTSNQLIAKSKEKKKLTYVWGMPPKIVGAGELELLHFPSSFDFGINNNLTNNDKLIETKSKEHIVIRELRGMTSETNAGNWKLSASAEQLSTKKKTEKLDSSVSYLFTTTLKQYENNDDSLPPSEGTIIPPNEEQKEAISVSNHIELPTDGATIDIMKAIDSPDGRYALELEKTQLKIPKEVKTERSTYNGNITWILADTI